MPLNARRNIVTNKILYRKINALLSLWTKAEQKRMKSEILREVLGKSSNRKLITSNSYKIILTVENWKIVLPALYHFFVKNILEEVVDQPTFESIFFIQGVIGNHAPATNIKVRKRKLKHLTFIFEGMRTAGKLPGDHYPHLILPKYFVQQNNEPLDIYSIKTEAGNFRRELNTLKFLGTINEKILSVLYEMYPGEQINLKTIFTGKQPDFT